MANIGHIEIEVKPTVTFESAVACVFMLNLFLGDNDEYDLVCVDRGDGFKWELTDEPRPGLSKTIASLEKRDSQQLTDYEKEILADMPALKNLARMAGMETE